MVYAHAFLPTQNLDGDIHFNDDREWIVSETEIMGNDVYYVAAHEIGHSLGLMHSKNEDSIMYYRYRKRNISVKLDTEDVERIEDLYGPEWRLIMYQKILASLSSVTTSAPSTALTLVTNSEPTTTLRPITTLEPVTTLGPITTSDPEIPRLHVCGRRRRRTRRRGCRPIHAEISKVVELEDANECKKEGNIPDPTDCQKYFRCIKNIEGGYQKVPETCRAGWLFNRKYSDCDWSHNVQDCHKEA